MTLHGHIRATVDLDLVIDLVSENAANAVNALTDLGLRPRLPVQAMDFADPKIRAQWVTERNLKVFSMWHPANPAIEVDIFADPPIDPAALLADAALMQLADIQVSVASRRHLIEMKRLAGRAQDLADIAALTGSDGD